MKKIPFYQRLNYFLFHISPQELLIRVFVALILFGALILWLPQCQQQPIAFLDCLFTATSAVCVTGLITVDFPQMFNQYGQFAVLILIQLGGLGVLTFAALSFKIIGAHISMTSQAALTDAVMQKDGASEFRQVFYKILVLIVSIEFCGMIFLTLERWQSEPLLTAIWQGTFHSVSAFCNAGFSLWSESLCGQSGLFCVIIMVLIFFGGIGQLALVDIFRALKQFFWLPTNKKSTKNNKHKRLSYNTYIALVISGILIIWGVAILFITDWDSSHKLTWFDALFQSVSARTAGFNNFDQANLSRTDILATIFLMFIGGSPGSCAGGIKTTTFAIWLATCLATLGNRNEYTFAGRKIPEIIVSKARKLIQFSLIWNAVGLFILCRTEDAPIITLLYEQISAFGTVGLSLNFTGDLSTFGKVWIILTMFVGRMGPLTIALGIKQLRQTKVSLPDGRIMIG